MSDLSTVPPGLLWYFEHPGCWDSIKKAILDHDKSCASLAHVWLARTGGVTCPSDIDTCDDCRVTFYNEGLLGQYRSGWKMGDPIEQTERYPEEEPGELYDAVLCDCCGRKRREPS